MVHRIQNRNPGYSDFSSLNSAQSFNFSGSSAVTSGANALKVEEEILKPSETNLGEEQLINQNINMTVDDSSMSQNDESLVLTEEVKKEDNDSNGLEEFGLNEEEPNLFDTSTNNLSSEEELNHERLEDNSEEDDYEIPAFLRRQKN